MSTPPSPPAAGGDTGLAENVAGLLSYVAGWITGLIFFLIDKRPFVRFHAAQSLVLFGALTIIYFVYWILTVAMAFGGVFLITAWGFLGTLIWLLSIVLWIVCMVKAYQGQRFRVPVVADFADKLAK
jgi:uncharacterized membrane protein